jgi:hypothetical protein
VGVFYHFWVAIVTAFVVGARLKSNMPDATLLPLTGALIAGLTAGSILRRIEFRGRSDA